MGDDIITYERNRKLHRMHVDRLRKMKPSIDTTTPKSLGLKHMQIKPSAKAKQLIDDRNHWIAFENRKLMENMTKIMAAPNTQPKYEKPHSLNETERKLKVELINLDNSLMLTRLKKVPPVIEKKEFEEAWKRHLEFQAHMKRKSHNIGKSGKGKGDQSGSLSAGELGLSTTFDSSSYLNQQQSLLFEGGVGIGGSGSSPIRSIAEFRKHVISKKKTQSRDGGDGYRKLCYCQYIVDSER